MKKLLGGAIINYLGIYLLLALVSKDLMSDECATWNALTFKRRNWLFQKLELIDCSINQSTLPSHPAGARQTQRAMQSAVVPVHLLDRVSGDWGCDSVDAGTSIPQERPFGQHSWSCLQRTHCAANRQYVLGGVVLFGVVWCCVM